MGEGGGAPGRHAARDCPRSCCRRPRRGGRASRTSRTRRSPVTCSGSRSACSTSTPRRQRRAVHRAGHAYLHFFPDGHTERALIHLGTELGDDDQYTLVVHGLTGRVEVRPAGCQPPRGLRRRRTTPADKTVEPMSARAAAGFTLLEVMIAMAILAGALLGAVAGGGPQRARQPPRPPDDPGDVSLPPAARASWRSEFVVNGFTDDSLDEGGEGRVRGPGVQEASAGARPSRRSPAQRGRDPDGGDQALQDKQQIGARRQARLAHQGLSPPLNAAPRGSLLGPVKEMLEQGIRRVTVRVLWDEPGRPPTRWSRWSTFYTDMRRT